MLTTAGTLRNLYRLFRIQGGWNFGSHSSNAENRSLLGCEAVSMYKQLPMSQNTSISFRYVAPRATMQANKDNKQAFYEILFGKPKGRSYGGIYRQDYMKRYQTLTHRLSVTIGLMQQRRTSPYKSCFFPSSQFFITSVSGIYYYIKSCSKKTKYF